jgi:hypothetical protein
MRSAASTDLQDETTVTEGLPLVGAAEKAQEMAVCLVFFNFALARSNPGRELRKIAESQAFLPFAWTTLTAALAPAQWRPLLPELLNSVAWVPPLSFAAYAIASGTTAHPGGGSLPGCTLPHFPQRLASGSA